MAELVFLLDGQDRGQPVNLDTWGFQVQEIESINIRFVSFDNDLVFAGAGYDYFISKSHLDLVDVQILNSCANGSLTDFTRGSIKVSDCSFDLDRCEVRCIMEDDSYAARIDNNKTIPVYSNSEITKNNLPIAAPALKNILCFLPQKFNGVDIFILNAQGYHIYDWIKHVLTVISDDKIIFESDFFDTGDGRKYAITSGASLHFNAQDYITNPVNQTGSKGPWKITFENLISFVVRKFNLMAGIERVGGSPVFRLEQASYWQTKTPSIHLPDVADVIQLFDRERIFSSTGFGDSNFLEEWECNGGQDACTYPQITFRTFKEEEFALLGETNIDRKLPLESESVVYDTNLIEDILFYSNLGFEESPIIIECSDAANRNSASYVAQPTVLFGLTNNMYNASLRNELVAQRWIGGVPNSIFDLYSNISPGDMSIEIRGITGYNVNVTCGGVFLLLNLDQIEDSTVPVFLSDRSGTFLPLNLPIINPLGSWSVPQNRYNTPIVATGSFRVRFTVHKCFTADPFGANVRPVIRRYRADGTFIRNYFGVFEGYFITLPPTLKVIDQNITVFMNSGDYFQVDIQAQRAGGLGVAPVLLVADNDTDQFARIESNNDWRALEGGELEEYDPNDFPILKYEFPYPLSVEQVNALVNNSSSPITFDRGNGIEKCLIKQAGVENLLQKNATFSLIKIAN